MKSYPLPEGSTIDYYRSSNSQGVKNDARIGIAIGVANTPTNTFDYACSTLEESRSLRFQGVHAATWQAWSRIKDPIGKAPSTLYCIGVRAEVIDAVISHGSGRVVTYNGKDGNNRTIPPTIILKEKLPRPKVLMEARTKIALEPRKVSSELYIDCLVPLEDRILYELADCRVKDQHNYIYNHICDYVGKLPKTPFKLYNPGVTEDWIKNNSILFYTNIITRTDKCGKQSHTPNKGGKYPYPNEKVKIPFNELLIQHFEGKETIANPPFNTEDICYWCAVDFDDHDGTTPQTKNVNTFVTYLRSLNIPYFVLLSGSNLGYHVWILLEPCKTYTAHKFIRQCLEDTGLNSKGLEKFPVQKKASNAKNGYGNQLKLPNAFNWKANRRSLLVDPITLKPTPYIEITHVLRLHEIPDVPKSKKAVSSKIIRHIPVNDGRKYGEMRACLIKALEYPLVGGIGHTMRVIIANEAINVGMDREAVIDLFRSQNDFVYDITASQVDFAMQKKYHKWMCLTIRENCSELVDCENCTQYIKSKMELA